MPFDRLFCRAVMIFLPLLVSPWAVEGLDGKNSIQIFTRMAGQRRVWARGRV